MPTQTLVLDAVDFPDALPNDRANFRIICDVKYWSGTGAQAKLKMANSVKPGVDTFWECDEGQEDKANFVRTRGGSGFESSIAVMDLDRWEREVVSVETTGVHSVRVKLYDVDRKDFWDKVKDALGSIIEGVLGAAKKAATTAVPNAVSDATGDSIDEVSSYLVKKITGGGDKVLFQGSAVPDDDGVVTVTGFGTNGRKGREQYTVVLSIDEEEPPA